MDNKKKIIFGLIAGIIFIIAFILNLLFPPKPFVRSAHAVEGSLDSAIQYFLDHPEANLQELVQDETHYNYLKDYAASRFDVELPAWESSGTNDDVYNFFRNISSGFIGQYAFPNDANLVSLIGSVSDLEDFLEFIDFDSEAGEFIVSPNNSTGLVDRVNHVIYTEEDSVLIGNWLPANQNQHFDNFIYSSSVNNSMCLTVANPADFYFTVVHTNQGYTFLVSCTSDSSWKYANIYYGTRTGSNMSFLDGNTFSNGSTWSVDGNNYKYLSFAWRYGTVGGSSQGSITPYASVNEALYDLWGADHPGEAVLTGAIIVDDNPTFTGISLPSADVYDYSTTIVNNYNNEVDTPIPHKTLKYLPYNYTYTIPYDDTEYELPSYPEIPHDLPQVSLSYPEITANEEIQEGMNGLNSLWVTLLTMGGSFIVLKVIL